MRLKNIMQSWVFAFAATSLSFSGLCADHFERLHDHARNIEKNDSLEIDEDLGRIEHKIVKGKLISFLFIQDTYLSYAAQLTNGSVNGLDTASFDAQSLAITDALLENNNKAKAFLTPIFGNAFATQFAFILSQEASFFMSYFNCNLTATPGCDASTIAANWEATVPPLYAALLNRNPAHAGEVLAFAQARTLAQQEESGLNGLGNPNLTFAESFNSLQIYLPESIRAAVQMVQTSRLPKEL